MSKQLVRMGIQIN